jgi:hypothetical protein
MRWTARSRLALLALATLGAAVGCATTPTGPSVVVLPGEGRSHEQFRTDDARCRAASATDLPATAGGYVSPQARYDMVYMQCMYAAGHQVPMRGAPPRSRDVPPAPPAGTPPPPPPAPSTPPSTPPATR